MGNLIMFLIIAIFVLYLYINNNKFVKWLLPTLSFLFSIYIIWFMITFELTDYINKGKELWEIFNSSRIFDLITVFAVSNIPTVIFLIINRYRRTKWLLYRGE